MKSQLFLLLLNTLPCILWAQFSVEPQPKTLETARVKCVTVFESRPDAVPQKARNTCYLSSGKIQFDSVYNTNPEHQTDTLKDKQQRVISIQHFKRDSLLYTEKFIYLGDETGYAKRLIATGKRMVLADSVVYNERNQVVFKHHIDSGTREFFTYHPSHHQLVFVKTENHKHVLLRTDSLIYDSLVRHIETQTLNPITRQHIGFKRTYTKAGLPQRDSYFVNGKQTESVQYAYNAQQQLMDQTVIKSDKSMERRRYTYLKNGLPDVCFFETRSPKTPGGFQLMHRKMFRYTYF